METTPSQASNTAIPKTKAERKRLLAAFPGILTAIARRHKVNSGTVSLVFNGHSTSARITAAIEKEIARRAGNQESEQHRSAA